MSKMAPMSQKKRKLQDGMRGKTDRPKKRIRKQQEYHSSSDESDEVNGGFAPVNLNDSDEEHEPVGTSSNSVPIGKRGVESEDGASRDSESDDEAFSSDEAEDAEKETAGSTKRKTTSKRNDPEAFSTSISKILSTKLSQSARKDPVLSRSREANDTRSSIVNERLEKKAKAKLRADRNEELEKGRVKDVLGLETGQAGEVAEEEKRLRKIAQRGVVKLFNAVRAAQVRGEQAAKEERKKGTVGFGNREEKVNEMSKQGFLDLISGKKDKKLAVEA